MTNAVREGTNESDSTQNFTSFLTIRRRQPGRLQEELTQTRSELKLSGTRDFEEREQMC